MSQRIAKYEVLEKIAEGGFGTVYKARDPFIKRLVAIKTCSVADEEMARRFFREAEIAGRFDHPNVTIVHDFGVEDQTAYLVQEYLSGEDLLQKIRRRDALPVRQKVEYLLQIANGLAYAHSQQVIHRDIKPANLRVLENGQVKILDFGIAKLATATTQLTQKGMAVGTLGYLSPEQLRDQELDTRTDIFSYGVVAYELLTYSRPFSGKQLSALMDEILHHTPTPVSTHVPDCPPSLERVVERCLEKDRDLRYQSFNDVAADLEEVRRELTSSRPVPVEAVAAATEASPAGEGNPITRPIPLPVPAAGPTAAAESAPLPGATTAVDAGSRGTDVAVVPPAPTVVMPAGFGPLWRDAAGPVGGGESAGTEARTVMRAPWGAPSPPPSPPPPPVWPAAGPAAPTPAPPPVPTPPRPPAAPTVMMAAGDVDALGPQATAPATQATAAAAPPAHPAAAKAGRRPPWLWIAVGGAAMAGIALLAVGWIVVSRSRQAPAPPVQAATPHSAAVTVVPTAATVVVLGMPWGELESLRDAGGRELPLPVRRETPLLLTLPAGHYVATLRHPAAATPASCEVDAVVGQAATCRAELLPLEPLQYFKEAGWWR